MTSSLLRATPLHFSPKGAGIGVNLQKLIVTRGLVQANSGGGKSTLLRAMLEQTYSRIQQYVFDLEGEFPTLRKRFDYLLVAKSGGDVVASARTAAVLCRRLAELRLHAIFDLYDLSQDEQREFAKNFLNEQVNLPRQLWRPRLVVVDEAHKLCPEKGAGEAQSKDAMIDAGSRGRKRGLCLVAATQRISKLHKDLCAELLNKWVGRTALDVDMDRAARELGFGADKRLLLRDLEPGDFFAYGPAVCRGVEYVRGPEAITKAPASGKRSSRPPPPSAHIRKLLAKELVDLPKEAEEHERSIQSLEAQVRDLKRQLSSRQREDPVTEVRVETKTKVVKVEVPILTHAQEKKIDRLGKALASVQDWGPPLRANLEALVSKAQKPQEVVLQPQPIQVPSSFPSITKAIHAARVRPPRSPNIEAIAKQQPGEIGKGERIVLTAIAQDGDGIDSAALAVLTGYKETSRRTYLQKLASSGLIEGRDPYRATAAGIDALGPGFQPLPRGDALREHWLRKLGGGEQKLLELLVADYPGQVGKDQLKERANYKETSVRTYLQKLAARKLITVTRSTAAASPILFGAA